MSDLWLVKIKFKQLKAFKKEIGKELMPVAWHQQIHFWLMKSGMKPLVLLSRLTKMCNKPVGNYVHVLEFVFSSYKTQSMFNEAVDTSSKCYEI